MSANKPYKNVEEFANEFKGVLSDKPATTLEKILERAYDIRKFEIDLYWKRASYFWGFLVASFTAYFIVSDSSKFGNKPQYEFLVMCLGFTFSLSWYLVNRGSKYWQSNWEKIIDALEDKLQVPLYRTNLHNTKKSWNLLSRYPFSVSRINIIVSLYISLIWLGLIIGFFFRDTNRINFAKPINWNILCFALLTIGATLSLLTKGQSNKDSTETYALEQRYMKYVFPETEPPIKKEQEAQTPKQNETGTNSK